MLHYWAGPNLTPYPVGGNGDPWRFVSVERAKELRRARKAADSHDWLDITFQIIYKGDGYLCTGVVVLSSQIW